LYVSKYIFLPSLSNALKYWGCQFIGWGLISFINTFQIYQSTNGKVNTIFIDIITMVVAILLSHIARLKFYKQKWNKLKLEKLVLYSLIIIAAQALVLVMAVELASAIFIKSIVVADLYQHIWLGLYMASVFIFTIWTICYIIIKFVQRSRNMVIEKLQVENNIKQLEIKTIKNNLQPHFIFNALNSIRALVDEDPAKARLSITQLSNILRNSIQADKKETVPFKNELELVKDYLSLEGIRYEERLQTTYNISEDTYPLPIPPMMLQTLVENAIKHGIASLAKGGIINIHSSIKNKFHCIEIENTGTYNIRPNDIESNNGFGLDSTQQRLNILFGEQANLQIKNTKTGTVLVTIKIPLATI
jgi:two-component system, LytTR family, sensor kinase